jgi:flagellar basal-body rod protein FlgF
MDAGLYIAASGMLAQQVQQDQLANDLANASTPGYKPDTSIQTSFGDLLLSNVATGQPIGEIQTGVTISSEVTNLTPAAIQQTGQPLDFAIAGQGFFAVRTSSGVQYTRNGQFGANAQGQLVDFQGDLVLSQSGAPIKVSAGGTVPASAVGVFNVTGPTKQGNNLYAGTATGRATGTVEQGALEQSAVDPIDTMVQMITSLRAYQSGQQAIQSIAQTDQENAQEVGSLGG